MKNSGRDKFRWGVCIDDMWTYAGYFPPKSIIIPHFLTVKLPQGPFSPAYGRKLTRSESREIRKMSQLSTVALFDLSDAQKTELRRMLSKNLASSLRKNKVHFVRCWFQWNLFQPRIQPGREQIFDFPLDDFVSIIRKAGVEIIGVLGCGYYRFLPEGLDIDDPRVYVQRLRDSSREIVKRYAGKISIWQLENEPNWWLEHFASDWRRGGVWFQKEIRDAILEELHLIVREEDPAAQTMINLESDAVNQGSKSLAKYCDIFGLDYYPNYSHSSPIDVPRFDKARLLSKITEKPVMIAETGYPSAPSILGYSEERQAEYLKLACGEAYSSDCISGLGVWRLSDPYWFSFPFQENSFGLINRRGIPKKGWYAYLSEVKEKQ